MRDLNGGKDIELTLLEKIRENLENFLRLKITDKQLSHYLGQPDKYITYVKKNSERNPVYQISLQRLEEYIINIGERQHMNINMTSMSDKAIYDVTLYHLKRIRDKIGLNIPDNHLICSIIFKDEVV